MVLAPKGGVGKTYIASLIAQALMERASRWCASTPTGRMPRSGTFRP